MPYTLPQEELVKLFSQSCLRPISSILQIQQHRTFEEAITQAVVIKKVKMEDGEININNQERDKIPKQTFTSLPKSLSDILKKLYGHQIINLFAIKPENPKAKESGRYNKKDFFNYHH